MEILAWVVFWSRPVTAAATLVLAVMTGIYVVTSWKMLREMAHQREAASRPYISAIVEGHSEEPKTIIRENVGMANAVNIDWEGRYEIESDHGLRAKNHGHVGHLLVGKKASLKFPLPDHFAGSFTADKSQTGEVARVRMVVKVACRNIFGAEFPRTYAFMGDTGGWKMYCSCPNNKDPLWPKEASH